MTKFINRVDHVAWISKIDAIERNVAELSRLFDVAFEGPVHPEGLGFTVYLCWEAGLEIVAPHVERTDFNKPMHDYLDARGEGTYAVVFGVRDLAAKREWLLENGYVASEIWGDNPAAPWTAKVDLQELDGGFHINTQIIFSQIDYAKGVVTIE